MILQENIIHNKKLTVLVSVVIFICAFILRVYRLPEFIAYHQDQVRDLMFIKQHIDHGQWILLGPKASVGNFFLPPLWYYLMSGAYILSSSALTPALLVITFSALTAVLIYLFGRKFFSWEVAIFASILFTVSPISIEYGRFAWNPNPIPFFTTATLYFLFTYFKTRKPIYFYTAIIFANCTFQLHYQGFILVAVCFAALFYRPLPRLKNYFIAGIIFLVLLTPFFIYELTHKFENINNIIDFFVHRSSQGKSLGITNSVRILFYDYPRFIGRSLFFSNTIAGIGGFIVIHLYLLKVLIQLVLKRKWSNTALFGIVYSLCLVVLFLYRQWIVDYYLLVLLVPLILFFTIMVFNLLPKLFAVTLLSILILINLIFSPTFWPPKPILSFFENINHTVDSQHNTIGCITYNIHDSDLQFAKAGVEYLRYTEFKTTSFSCSSHYLICENSFCNNQGTLLEKNSQLGLEFRKL